MFGIDYKKDNRRDLEESSGDSLGDYGECIQAKADKMKDTWYQDSDGTWKKLPYKGDAKFLFECMATSPLILDLNGDGVEADGFGFFDHGGDGWAELSRWRMRMTALSFGTGITTA